MENVVVSDIKTIEPQIKANYYLPTKIYFGRGLFAQLSNLLVGKFHKVLIVAGEHIKASPEWQQIIFQLSSRLTVEIYPMKVDQSVPHQINQLLGVIRPGNFDLIVGVGGGTILDTVKSAAYLANANGTVEDYLTGKPAEKPGVAWAGVPTTAGTGSEVTPWATIWGADNKKHSLHHSTMFAKFAVVDPALTDNLPVRETALTGTDALAQAIEAYWSNKHNYHSDQYALQAIKVLVANLPLAIDNPSAEARDQTMWGALLAGMAFSNTQTTICHALSYPLTIGWNVSHGQAVAVTLPLIMSKILPAIEPFRKDQLLVALGANDTTTAVNKIDDLIKQIGLFNTLDKLGITSVDITGIAEEALLSNRLSNSPVIPSLEELISWLNTLMNANGSAPVVNRDIASRDLQWKKGLTIVKKILDDANITHWLDTGTLLGAVREGKFIGWDNDIDISAMVTDAPKVLALTHKFGELGYRVDVTDSSIYLSGKNKPTIGIGFYSVRNDKIWILFLNKPTKFDYILKHVRRVANKITYQPWHQNLPRLEQIFYTSCPSFLRIAIRKFGFWLCDVSGERNFALVLPKKFVFHLSTINFYDLEFKTPSPPDAYLAWMYGDDWRTPKLDWRWEDTKSLNYEFVPFTKRNDYNLLTAEKGNLEHRIVEQFDIAGNQWLESEVDENNFEWRALINEIKTSNPSTTKILEVGSGKGKFIGKLNRLGFETIGVEPSGNLLTTASKLYPETKFVLGSATAIPSTNNNFDVVICVETLEHIPDTNKAIIEMHRVLKPGGKLIIIDKNINSLHYLYFIPTAIWKWFKESTNQWMYKRSFPFREKYFVSSQLSAVLQQYFSSVRDTNLLFQPTQKLRTGLKYLFWWVHQTVSKLLHRIAPQLSFYYLWVAIK
ncbi:iron-containing alcohol dehydrogenase [Patescibacteria group bacterium]|nr:iron-containing alcohol dehydrogenase [Patescibacteria group bacterium]